MVKSWWWTTTATTNRQHGPGTLAHESLWRSARGTATSWRNGGSQRHRRRAHIFLHVIPVDYADLPRRSRLYGYQNLDFRWEHHGFSTDGRCFLMRSIPDYDIAVISTGASPWQGEDMKRVCHSHRPVVGHPGACKRPARRSIGGAPAVVLLPPSAAPEVREEIGGDLFDLAPHQHVAGFAERVGREGGAGGRRSAPSSRGGGTPRRPRSSAPAG